ncbi:hypothetical protein [Actinoplanes sp. DH11]|uniref:hypothetical protein n=1 Tax=Actinoplanes sp. DH11 TaxID=2857011 RepID=UPI001E4A409D|nr:hypothetical protein [Actinoplanes sp. DH11]
MPLEFSDQFWEGLSAKQREGLIFMEQMTGAHLTDSPPPPGSPLARLEELVRQQQAGLITQEEGAAAMRRVMAAQSEES